MNDISVIAQYFLFKASMPHKKLQKLCYYAQAWHLANFGTPLMQNSFEAWVHGPVSPDLYFQYREWGWLNIPKVSEPPILSQNEQKLLDQTYEVYGGYTADELETITKMETPWKKARIGCSPNQYSRNPISMEDMRNYYGERIKK